MFRVMLVEDEMLVRLGLKHSIPWDRYGMIVAAEATDGESAWDAYLADRPDLIITDLKLPGMSGMDLISRIRERDTETRIVILSCLEEFELAQRAMALGVSNYLLKLTMTPDEIDRVLASARDELAKRREPRHEAALDAASREAVKERVLQNSIAGTPDATRQLAEAVERLGLRLTPRLMVLCRVVFDGPGPDAGAKTALANALSDVLGAHGSAEAFPDGEHWLLVLNSTESGSPRRQRDLAEPLLKKIREVLRTYFNLSCSVGVSGARSGYEHLGELYRQCTDALAPRFFAGSGTYTHGAGVDTAAIARRSLELLKKASTAAGRPVETFQREYERRIDDIAAALPVPRPALQAELGRLMQWVATTLHVLGGGFADAALASCEAVRSGETLEGIVQEFREFFASYRKCLRGLRDLSRETAAAVEYVGQNYAAGFTLEDVARHVALSPNYLSALFHREMQITLTEYVNEVRIEKATELLLGTYLKGYEIAERVGFNGTAYFTRVFHKLNGTSPTEFRRQWMKDWTESLDEDAAAPP